MGGPPQTLRFALALTFLLILTPHSSSLPSNVQHLAATNDVLDSADSGPGEETAPEAAGDSADLASSADLAAADLIAADLDKVFDFSSLSPTQTTWVRTILTVKCDFDWRKLEPGLAGNKVRIEIAEPSAPGMYYVSELRLAVNRYYYRLQRATAGKILAWELAHAVDMVSMTPEQRQQIIEFYDYGEGDTHQWLSGPYYQQVGEAFMEGFVAAFCPTISGQPTFAHVTTPEIAAKIRDLLD